MAQARQDPALDDQHRDLDLGLVARLAHPRRQDRRAVVRGEILVGAIDPRLVAAGGGDAGFQVVADDQRRHAAEKAEGVDVGGGPVGEPLAPARLRERVVRRAEHRDEDVRRADLAAQRVDDRHRVPGEVDEQLLAGDMGLAHGRGDRPPPCAVERTEPAVAVAVRMLGPVFLPQQQQRHTAATQLGVQPAPVRQRLRRTGMKARRREQPPFERGVVEVVGDRPGQPDHRRPTEVFRDRRAADAERPRDHPLTDAAGVLQTKNFSNLAHRQSLGGHRTSLACMSEETLPASRSPTTLTPRRYPRRPACRGTGGRLAQESVAAFPRNPRPPCRGICRTAPKVSSMSSVIRRGTWRNDARQNSTRARAKVRSSVLLTVAALVRRPAYGRNSSAGHFPARTSTPPKRSARLGVRINIVLAAFLAVTGGWSRLASRATAPDATGRSPFPPIRANVGVSRC